MSGRRLALYWGFYLVALLVAAGIATWRPELTWKSMVWGSVVGSVPLGWFVLGGAQLNEMRMQSRWPFLFPKLDRLPGIACCLFGFLLFEIFRRAFTLLAAIE